MSNAKPGPPPTCPSCGAKTSDNFVHPDNAEKWLTNCGVIVCTCEARYHRFTPKRTESKS